MSAPPPEKAPDQPLAPMSVSLLLASLLIGGVTFACGTVSFLVIGSFLFLTLSTEHPHSAFWALVACSMAAAAIMAAVTAWRWCRNARRRAALSASDKVGDRRVFQFTLRSFLLFQFCVALALGMIRWLGGPVIPAVAGVASAAVGYWLTLFLARRRVYNVVISYLFGAAAGLVVYALIATSRDSPADPFSPAPMKDRIGFIVFVIMVPVIAAIAGWRLRRREQSE